MFFCIWSIVHWQNVGYTLYNVCIQQFRERKHCQAMVNICVIAMGMCTTCCNEYLSLNIWNSWVQNAWWYVTQLVFLHLATRWRDSSWQCILLSNSSIQNTLYNVLCTFCVEQLFSKTHYKTWTIVQIKEEDWLNSLIAMTPKKVVVVAKQFVYGFYTHQGLRISACSVTHALLFCMFHTHAQHTVLVLMCCS